MKQTYQKPEVEVISLIAMEMIANGSGTGTSVGGTGGYDPDNDPWA